VREYDARGVTILGNSPVLAPGAGEVAAVGSDGENLGTGKEVVQRFFLDRIEMERTYFGVISGEQMTINNFSAAARSDIPFVQQTLSGTNVASDFLPNPMLVSNLHLRLIILFVHCNSIVVF